MIHFKNRFVVIIVCVFLFAMAAAMIFPFLWMILTSFKTSAEVIQVPPTLYPHDPTFENYVLLWDRYNFARYFANSIFIAFVCVTCQVYTSALFGYVLEKYEFKGRNIIFSGVLLCMMVPSTVNVIPLYQLMLWLKLINTHTSVIIVNLISLFGIFLMKQFAKTIPNELIEAARIDGAGEFKIFHKVCLPLFKNPISALAIMQFLWTWDSYLWPLLMLGDEKKYTITVGLGALNGGQYGVAVEKLLTGASIAIVPVLIVFFIFQKRFVDGMASSGLKG